MESSEDAATTNKCFSAILSRLLCSGSLPTHPSDHLPQLTSSESTHQPKASKTESNPIQAPSSTPGIVARLMGLDPFPDTTSLTKRRTLDSILRSRSANSVDYYLPRLDFAKQAQMGAQDEAHDQARHRRVRTSMSFRDVPTFLHPQNHDLLLLCLDQVDEISRKSELGLKEMVRGENNGSGRERVSLKKREKEEKKKKSCKRKEEEVTNGPSPRPMAGNVLGQKRDVHGKPSVSLKGKSPEKRTLNRKEISDELKATKKRGKGNGSRSRSKNSSSKSSCGLRDSPLRVKAPPIISENSGPMGLTSSKISSPRLDKYDHSRTLKDDDQELKSKTNEPLKTKESDYLVVDMLIEVCRLAEEDIKRGAVWIARNDLEFKEICFKLEQETLEMLMDQLVDELCGSSQD